MPRTKKLEITEVIQESKEIQTVTTNDLNFQLNAEIIAGSLTSNAKELKAKIESELKNYTVEKYTNNPDAAKSDKALLNKIEKTVADKRKEITSKWNEPLNEFMVEMKEIESSIFIASQKINSIVKEAETKEKDEKKKQIENYWSTLDFNLVSLDKIFNPKWLNKTYKMDQIMLDCESLTEKIHSELSTLKSMNDPDAEILQSFYLDTLDLNATLTKGNQLKANRQILEQQKVEIIKDTFKGEIVGNKPEICRNPTNSEPITVKDPVIQNNNEMTFTLRLTGPKEKLIALRKYIDANGIKYEKV